MSALLAVAGLVLAGSGARAQPASAPSSGLLGSNYAGLSFGYIRLDDGGGFAPAVAREYEAVDNQALMRGLDLNVSFDDSRAKSFGHGVGNDIALAGLTAYQEVNPWLKPFLTAQGGIAWTKSIDLVPTAGIGAGGLTLTSYSPAMDHGTHFTSLYAAGAEFQVLPALTLAPFASYEEIHRFAHGWNYGVKAAYRFAPNWSATLTPQIDQQHDLEYQAGINYHF